MLRSFAVVFRSTTILTRQTEEPTKPVGIYLGNSFTHVDSVIGCSLYLLLI